MRKTFAALVAAVLLSFGLTVAGVQPVQAAPAVAETAPVFEYVPVSELAEEDCPESNIYGYVCLWKWTQFGGGRYQGKLDAIGAIAGTSTKPDGCWNLSGSTFGSPHLGDPVNNESASLVIEPSVLNWQVNFYDWVNCNPDSFLYGRSAYNTYTAIRHLGAVDTSPCYPGSCYHKFTSIRVIT